VVGPDRPIAAVVDLTGDDPVSALVALTT
jgi:hypothetical protein